VGGLPGPEALAEGRGPSKVRNESQDVRQEDLRQVPRHPRHGVVRVICDNKRHKQRQREVNQDARVRESTSPRTSASTWRSRTSTDRSVLAKQLLAETKIDGAKRSKELSEEQVAQINQLIERKYVVEGQLRRQVMQNIQRLKEIKSYRGLRHNQGPSRTRPAHAHERTNAQGPRRTVARKKSVKELS